MAEKVAETRIERNDDRFLYYVKNGAIWSVPKPPREAKGDPQMVVDAGVTMEQGYLYFVDKDGDISRTKRSVGGQKRKKPAKKKPAKKKPAKKKPAKKKPAKKKPAKKKPTRAR